MKRYSGIAYVTLLAVIAVALAVHTFNSLWSVGYTSCGVVSWPFICVCVLFKSKDKRIKIPWFILWFVVARCDTMGVGECYCVGSNTRCSIGGWG